MAKNIDFYIASKIAEAAIISAANTVNQNGASRVYTSGINPDEYVVLPDNYNADKDEQNLLQDLSDPSNFRAGSGIHPDTIKMLVNSCTDSINEFVSEYIDDYAKIIDKTKNRLQTKNEFKGSEGELFGATLGEFVANKSMGNDIILINDWDRELQKAVNNCVQTGNLDYDAETCSFMIVFKDDYKPAPTA